MRELDITVSVLQHERARPLQDPRAAAREPRGVPAAHDLLAARLDPDKPHASVADEPIEDADRVAAAAHARDDGAGQPSGEVDNLRPRLASDDRLKFADHQRVWVRTKNGAEQIICGAD